MLDGPIAVSGQPTTSNMGSQCVSISGAVRMGIYQASSCNANAMEPGFLGGRMHRKRAFAQFLEPRNGPKACRKPSKGLSKTKQRLVSAYVQLIERGSCELCLPSTINLWSTPQKRQACQVDRAHVQCMNVAILPHFRVSPPNRLRS